GMPYRLSLPLLVLLASACPETVARTDQRVVELLAARQRAQAEEYGFTPIEPSASFKLEGVGRGYDAMLHVYGRTSRTIAFARRGGAFRWIGEQEVFQGPLEYDTPDGTLNESLILTFETEPISGVPLGQLAIRYDGPRSRFLSARPLHLA